MSTTERDHLVCAVDFAADRVDASERLAASAAAALAEATARLDTDRARLDSARAALAEHDACADERPLTCYYGCPGSSHGRHRFGCLRSQVAFSADVSAEGVVTVRGPKSGA